MKTWARSLACGWRKNCSTAMSLLFFRQRQLLISRKKVLFCMMQINWMSFHWRCTLSRCKKNESNWKRKSISGSFSYYSVIYEIGYTFLAMKLILFEKVEDLLTRNISIIKLDMKSCKTMVTNYIKYTKIRVWRLEMLFWCWYWYYLRKQRNCSYIKKLHSKFALIFTKKGFFNFKVFPKSLSLQFVNNFCENSSKV